MIFRISNDLGVLLCFSLVAVVAGGREGAIVSGEGISIAAVGIPSRIEIQLLDEFGRNKTYGGEGARLIVFSSPPPLSGTIKDQNDGIYVVELVHEWETKSSPQHGLTNVTVLLDREHVGGSPFIFPTTNQYAVFPRPATTPVPPIPGIPCTDPKSSAKYDGAYVTLVATDEFSLGALTLAFSLRRVGAKYPLVAMLTRVVSAQTERTLLHAGVVVSRVEPVHNPYAAFKSELEEKSWEQVYTKVQAWSLVDYRRVVFMDADQLVQRNIDHLFQTPMQHRLAASPDVAPPIFFNSGFMMLEPSAAIVTDMLEKMHVLPSYDDGDQGFLNSYFNQEWDRLAYTYNFMKSKTGNPDAFYWLLDHQWGSIYVFHMVGVKPWKCSRLRDCGGFPERVIPRLWALWWDFFVDMCQTTPQLLCLPGTRQTSEQTG